MRAPDGDSAIVTGSGSEKRVEVLKEAIDILERYKARSISIYDVGRYSVIADWFVIATGDADRHLDAMAAELRSRFKAEQRRTIEGRGETGWILVDLGDIVVHLFTETTREYYALDAFWNAAFVDNAE